MTPVFSIIIPTLNEEKYLPRLLRDIKNQSFIQFEVIVVDGNSTDHTREKVQTYEGKFPISCIVSNKRNLCYQRNLGAENSSGEYLIFLDADIQLDKDYLQETYKKIRRSGAKFLTTYQLPDVQSKIDIYLMQLASYTLEILILINKQMAPGYNFIVKKDIFYKAGAFDNASTFSEDHDLSIRIWTKTKVRLTVIRKPLLKWSFRRLQKNGRMPIILKYTFATLHILVFGKITDKNFSYPMGGDYFTDVDRVRKQLSIKAYFKRFKQLFEDQV